MSGYIRLIYRKTTDAKQSIYILFTLVLLAIITIIIGSIVFGLHGDSLGVPNDVEFNITRTSTQSTNIKYSGGDPIHIERMYISTPIRVNNSNLTITNNNDSLGFDGAPNKYLQNGEKITIEGVPNTSFTIKIFYSPQGGVPKLLFEEKVEAWTYE